MTTKAIKRSQPRFVVLDSTRSLPSTWHSEDTLVVSKRSELTAALEQSTKQSDWVILRASWIDSLLDALRTTILRHQDRQSFLGNLVLCEPVPRIEVIPQLHQSFQRVTGDLPSFKMLPKEQLAEVLRSSNKDKVFIGGLLDRSGKTLTLTRGDLSTVTIPLKFFWDSGATKESTNDFELDDFGYVVRFGDFEVSAHSILFNVDAKYRREMNEKRRKEEKGFGPSLRRLRLMRRLDRDAFPDVSAKTIARIERGETDKPHGRTLETIARVLSVSPDEIESY